MFSLLLSILHLVSLGTLYEPSLHKEYSCLQCSYSVFFIKVGKLQVWPCVALNLAKCEVECWGWEVSKFRQIDGKPHSAEPCTSPPLVGWKITRELTQNIQQLGSELIYLVEKEAEKAALQ